MVKENNKKDDEKNIRMSLHLVNSPLYKDEHYKDEASNHIYINHLVINFVKKKSQITYN